MAVRIEYLLMMVFAILLVSIFGVNPSSKEAISAKGQKEVEFDDFSVHNIKEDNSGKKIEASSAVKYKKYIDFYDVNVTDELGHTLVSNRAVYEGNTLYMNQNVKVSRADGIEFYSESLNYTTKDKIVTTDAPFLLEFNKSVIRGEKLELDVNRDSISAYNVNASIWFVKEQ